MGNWVNIGASVAGKGHHLEGVPCQDAHSHEALSNFWGIAVISDGAGSHSLSHLASSFVVDNAVTVFKQILPQNDWFSGECIPSADKWREVAIVGLEQIRSNLLEYAQRNEYCIKNMGCTLIVAVYCERGVVAASIGDGRSCFLCEGTGEWEALTEPFKGPEVGTTVFLNTDWIWEEENRQEFVRTYTVEKPIQAIALLTDGMETYCFCCYTKGEDNRYFDPNQPFNPSFNANIKNIKLLLNENHEVEQVQTLWTEYLENGKNLREELDDKTMLICIRI